MLMAIRFMVAAVAAVLIAGPAQAQERELAMAAAAADRAMMAMDAVQARAREPREGERDQKDRDAERADRQRDQEMAAFDQAYSQMDAGRWDRAVEAFARVAAMKGTRADGALYWQAYSQDRIGQRAEALATIAELAKTYPASRYVKQAQALEMEVRRNVGQPVNPEAQGDEELKLIAVNSLLNSDPEKALPILEKLLQGPASPRVRERAVFVLAQSNSPRAREILKNLARGSSTPELQSKAIQYLGVMGGAESRATLAEVYSASTDVDVKRRILRAFMVSGDKQRVLTAAQTEQNADLRAEAVRQLGAMGANDELWQMYQKESAVPVKKQILQAMFVGGNSARMTELARSEKDPELRSAAVRNLGMMGGAKTGDTLVEIYNGEKDPAVRRNVLNALFVQGNATALVAIARKETDPELKKTVVQKLSMMQGKVVTDYMQELLSK
jgi:tetratricopeptide (TPR) repeat protein